jgi:hypothetical protein
MRHLFYATWTASLGLPFIGSAQAYAANATPPYNYADAWVGVAASLACIVLLVQVLRHWGRRTGSAADGNQMAVTGDGGSINSLGHSVASDCGFSGDGGSCGDGGGGDG